MRVARVKNSPEPAEHGLHLGAALAAATRRRPAFARLLPFALYQTKSKTKQKRMRGAASNRRDSRRHSYGRVEPGARTAPILGHRVVRVRRYPARFLKFCRRHGGEPHLPATGRTLRSGVGLDPGSVGGGGMPPPATLAGSAELSWAYGIAGASIELKLRSDGVEIKCRLGGLELSLPNRAHGVVLVVVALAPLPSLISASS